MAKPDSEQYRSLIPDPMEMDLVPNESFYDTKFSQQVRSCVLEIMAIMRLHLLGDAQQQDLSARIKPPLFALKELRIDIHYSKPNSLLEDPDKTARFLAAQTILCALELPTVNITKLGRGFVEEHLNFDTFTGFYRTPPGDVSQISSGDLCLFAAKNEDLARITTLFGAASNMRRNHTPNI